MGEMSQGEMPKSSVVGRVQEAAGRWLLKNLPREVENDVVEAYDRIVAGLDPGPVQDMAKRLDDAIGPTVAKVVGVGSAASDVLVSTLLGTLAFGKPEKPATLGQVENVNLQHVADNVAGVTNLASGKRDRIVKNITKGIFGSVVAGGTFFAAPVRTATRGVAHFAGLHGADIVNAITRRLPGSARDVVRVGVGRP